MPPEMSARYRAALADEDRLLNVTEDLALLEARLLELLARVDTGESKSAWQKLADANKELRRAMVRNNDEEITYALRVLSGLIDEGQGDYAAWSEIHDIVKSRSRLAVQERKTRIEERRIITLEEAMLAMQALMTAVRENVKDQEAIAAIRREFIRITNTPDRNLLTTTARVVGES